MASLYGMRAAQGRASPMRPVLSFVMGLLAMSASLWLLSTRSCDDSVAMHSPGAPPESVR